jgi:hypothetical protein
MEGVVGERRRAERRTMPATTRTLVEQLRAELRRPSGAGGPVEYKAVPRALLENALAVILSCHRDDQRTASN